LTNQLSCRQSLLNHHEEKHYSHLVGAGVSYEWMQYQEGFSL